MSQAGKLAEGSPSIPGIETLTGDTGGAVAGSGSPVNIDIVGGSGVEVTGDPGTSTLTIDISAGRYPITPYVVGSVGEGDYQTVQAGINAANAAGGGMVYLQPGTYTEDLTLYDGVHLVSVIYENSFEVQITGTHTPPASGNISFRGIRFNDATAIFSSAAAGSTTISCEECTFAVTNGYTFDLLNWTGSINCNDCGSAGTDDGFVNNTGGSGVFTNNGQFGAGTGQTCNISGDMRLDLTFLDCPLNVSAGNIFVNFALFSNTVICSGTSTGTFLLTNSFPSSGPSFNLTTSGDITIEDSSLTSSNNPCIDGTSSGTLTLGSVAFLDNDQVAGTLTVDYKPWTVTMGGTGISSATAYSVICAGTTSEGAFQNVSGLGSSGQVLTSNGAGALPTWQNANNGGWTDASGVFAAVSDTNYFLTASSTVTLPGSPSQGDTIRFAVNTGDACVITANTGQTIRLSSTTSSVAGTATNTANGDCLHLVYNSTSTLWMTVASMGNWVLA